MRPIEIKQVKEIILVSDDVHAGRRLRRVSSAPPELRQLRPRWAERAAPSRTGGAGMSSRPHIAIRPDVHPRFMELVVRADAKWSKKKEPSEAGSTAADRSA